MIALPAWTEQPAFSVRDLLALDEIIIEILAEQGKPRDGNGQEEPDG